MLTLLLTMILAGPPESVPAPKLAAVKLKAGYYRVAGLTEKADGSTSPYAGLGKLVPLDGNLWRMTWYTDDKPLVGLGVLQGESLQVSWTLPGKDGDETRNGLTTYKLDGAKLSGTWVWVGLPSLGRGTETMTYLGPIKVESVRR